MSNRSASGGQDDGWIPVPDDIQPQATIRSEATSFLIYDLDPALIPTETITRGGRRVVLDASGALREADAEAHPHYEILDKISEGGAGIVYRVREEALKREVALKISRVGLGSRPEQTQAASEFTNEAYMTARLDHPGVVPVYALAKDEEGRPFFAMKKVSGISWKDLLHPETVKDPERRKRTEAQAHGMTWKDQLQILLKVCDAVAYAHSKAILHRDLKPENILLGEYGEVYVMDWGLALYFDDRNEYKRFPHLKPQLAGTPSYIAPEMVRGQMTKLGPRSDVYLLGGILYEIMTGRPPHDGATVNDVLRNAAEGRVPPPEATGSSPWITPALIQIVGKALAREMADRYPSVEAFQEELRAYLTNAESMTVAARAEALLSAMRQELTADQDAADSRLQRMEKHAAAISYGRLSECIGGFRHAIELWPENDDARRGLLRALELHIHLAIAQDDLTLARAQVDLLKEIKAGSSDQELVGAVDRLRSQATAQIDHRQTALNRTARHARGWKAAAFALATLVVAGLVTIVGLSQRQRAQAIQSEKDMFIASVTGRAQMVEQFMAGIEQLAVLYQQQAVKLMRLPEEHLPWRADTAAGRDGYYFDEDFYVESLRPPGMFFDERYHTEISLDFPTVVRSPWARDEAAQAVVDHAASRLGRLNRLFASVHRTREDVLWSLAGSEVGLLIGFPGFGRYRDIPDYDATQRAWYVAAIDAEDDRPVWGNPYADASSRVIIVSCMTRIHVDGRNVGVVGVEITLDTLQKMLLDFAQSVGGKRRGLLVRPFEEIDPATGQPTTVHRVVVDTLYPRTAEHWHTDLELTAIEELEPFIASYYEEILAGQHDPAESHETGRYWLAHQPIHDHEWTFIAILEHGQRVR